MSLRSMNRNSFLHAIDLGILPDYLADHLPFCHKLWVEVSKVIYDWVHKLQMHAS